MINSIVRVTRHKGLGGLATAVYYHAKSVFFRAILGRKHLQKRIHDYLMLLDTADKGIGRTLILFGQREEEHRQMLQKVLLPGMTVLDIGGNIGYYALMERNMIGPSGRIVAVEPSTENIEVFKKNVELNGFENIDVIHGAISDKDGDRSIFLSDFSNLHSFHARPEGENKMSGRTEEVPTYTVQSVMADHGNPDLIRMDVEGHEVEVFNGMLESLEKGDMAPMVIFETHRRHYTPDHDMVEPLQRLFRCGYTTRYVGSSSAWGTEQVDKLGYKGGPPIATDFMTRHIYENISDDDAIDLICHSGGVRTVLLAKASG